MKRSRIWIVAACILLSVIGTSGQKKPVKTSPPKSPPPKTTVEKKQPADAVSSEKKVKDIIAFLEYMLNTLGSSGTPTRDKEVLITESYAKIFRDSKVQIEDDLDEDRVVITNKDIVAYLKDVNFFFNNVRFEFAIENIESSTLPSGELFYKVSAKRNLKGTTVDRKIINNSLPRYIEINYNPKDQDLKIVSIYTSGVDEKRALTGWWKELSLEWQTLFKKKLNLGDSVRLSDIKHVVAIESIDLSDNRYIQNIRPLGQLTNLKTLNLSGTNVVDLTPIRNLTELVELNASGTKIKDLTPLKYSSKLKRLDISYTDITDISLVEKMPDLQMLSLKGTRIVDFGPIAYLSKLEEANLQSTKIVSLTPLEKLDQLTRLNLSATPIQDLTSLRDLSNLQTLDLDSTKVKDVTPLNNLGNLNMLSMNYTAISNLMPLQKLPALEKVYCDQTPIKREAADAFMASNPKALVIFDSNDLKLWWGALTPRWQSILSKAARIAEAPSKEELAQVPLLDSVNLSGQSIRDLEPLRKLPKLKVVKINHTDITSLLPLMHHREITYLDISETGVADIAPISQFTKLKILKADNSKLEGIERVVAPSLEKLYADHTSIHDITAKEFLDKNPNCLLIYKTVHLKRWWSGLSEPWKEIFAPYTKNVKSSRAEISREDLHQLVERETLEIKDADITNLSGLSEFIRLNELKISGTAMASIHPLSNIRFLKSLQASGSPIQQIDSLEFLTELEELDISNTPLEDLYAVWKLKKLKTLNCSGTHIKRLDVLERLESLEYLDCSNTNVTKLDPLDYLNLKTLKCYNTKVSNRAIENFKASHPKCNVVYYR
jgi:Leucine-rich repeat (LRR) protein